MKKIFFKLIVIAVSLSIAGCATPGLKKAGTLREPVLVEIDRFCKDYSLDYQYYPFVDKIILENDYLNVELKPGYSFASVNNTIRNLYQPVTYNKGRLYIPSSLGFIIDNFKRTTTIDEVSSFVSVKVERIVVDPGHGGRDPGAISPWGLQEKDVNLEISRHLKYFLEQRGFEVFLTRNSDRHLSLKERVDFAKRIRADLFISVHANAYRSSRMKGFEVYYLSSKFSDSQSKVLAVAENLCQNQGLNLSLKLKQALGKILNSQHRKETLALASSIMAAAENIGIYTHKTIGAPFYVLKYNLCPAVLVEVGYLTNRDEEKRLRTEIYRKQLALAIAEGVFKLKRYVSGKMQD